MARTSKNIDRPNRTKAVKNLSAKQKKKKANRRMIIAVAIVLVVLTTVIVITQFIPKISELNKLKTQEAELKQEYKKELQLSKELKEKKKFVQTDDYVEDMARKLGLLYPNEVILQPEK